MNAQSNLWIVIDPKAGPEFAAAWRDGAHEHIKDAIEGGIQDASRWVVREYVPYAEAHAMRAEVEALRADNKHLRGAFEKAWPDAERCRHLISAEPAWVVSLFENGFSTAEIVDMIDAARAAQEKKNG